ncbi:MAG: T9SS type A sorting domain-containing protein [Balneolaceae bacterium]
MKKLLLLPLFVLIPLLANAQEKFFHDLKGMEDSEGVTQLFYRVYEEFDLGTANCGIDRRNDILHLNTATMMDSTFYPSFHQTVTCSPYELSKQNTPDFLFMDGNMDKWVKIDAVQDAYLLGSSNAYTYNGSFFDGYARSLGLGKNDTLQFVMMNLEYKNSASIVLHNDSLPSIQYPYDVPVKVASNNEGICTEVGTGCYFGATDSVIYHDFNFIAIDGRDSSKVFYQRNDSLFYSDYRADSLHFLNADHKWSTVNSFRFSAQQNSILAVLDSSSYNSGPHAYKLMLSQDDGANWFPPTNEAGLSTDAEYPFADSTKIFAEFSSLDGSSFYAAGGNTLYEWSQVDEKLHTVHEFENKITGLYVSGIDEQGIGTTYILTKNELFAFSNGTMTSIKKLPVSNELEPSSQPNQITLFQNYPNPFNPSTIISYQLPVSGLVKLDVFDMLGRKVATLIDGRTPAGLHEVTFNAQGLSSGMYFYRLKANGITETKRLTIIK